LEKGTRSRPKAVQVQILKVDDKSGSCEKT
jgi:hypothetical protein